MQFGVDGLILYWSRIRKFVTYRIRKNVENRQTEKAFTEATLSPYQWNSRWNGPTEKQTEKRITEAPLIAVPMERRVERANTTHN